MTCGESLCVCMYVCVYAVCTYLDEAERGRGRERKSTPPRLASFCARALLLPFFSFPHLSTDKRPVCRNSYTRGYGYKERADSNVPPLHLEEKSADHEPDFGMLIFLHLIDCRAPLPDRPKDLCGAAIRPRQRRCSDCHWLAAWRNSARLAELPVGCGPPSASLNTQSAASYSLEPHLNCLTSAAPAGLFIAPPCGPPLRRREQHLQQQHGGGKGPARQGTR